MIQIAKTLLIGTSALLFIGCGTDTVDLLTGSSSGSSSSSVTLNMIDDKSRFTITLEGEFGVGADHMMSSYKLVGANDTTSLSNHLGYSGTLTTTCDQTGAGNNSINYSCTIIHDYTTVTGKPSNETKDITLLIGQKYDLSTTKTYLQRDNTTTQVDSFTL
jgi:hypothetical protein